MWDIMMARIAWEMGDLLTFAILIIITIIASMLFLSCMSIIDLIRVAYYGWEWSIIPGKSGVHLIPPTNRHHSKYRSNS